MEAPVIKKYVFIIKVFFALLLLSGIFYSYNFAQKTKKKLQQDKDKIEQDIEYTNKLLNETKRNKQISLTQLIILNKKVNQREVLINNIHSELDDIDGQINDNSGKTTELLNKLRQYKEEYAKMIVYAYKNRNPYTRLMFVFASSDINQAFLRLKYLQQFTQYRKMQVEDIKSATAQIGDNINELKNIKNDKTHLLTKEEVQKLTLAQEKDEENNSLKKLQQKESELIKTIKEKEKEAKKLQQSIESSISQEIYTASNKTTNNTPATTNTTKVSIISKELGLTEAEITLSNNFSSNKGKLPWPTEKGIVTSTFGIHPHPVLAEVKIKNNGIDISTEQGAKARAVFDGKVTGVINIPGANKAVIIRHGEYLTVYSNLSNVSVTSGQKVKTKQDIGTIATDSDDTKTELHFEVWYGKTLTDPQTWLAPN